MKHPELPRTAQGRIIAALREGGRALSPSEIISSAAA